MGNAHISLGGAHANAGSITFSGKTAKMFNNCQIHNRGQRPGGLST